MATTLLRIPDPDRRAAFESLPRALRAVDLKTLDELLRKHAAAPLPDLRQSANGAMPSRWFAPGGISTSAPRR